MAVESNIQTMAKLKDLENAVRLAEINNVNIQTDKFLVLNLSRYLIDPIFVKQTGSSVNEATDAYDITLADRTQKRKLVLSPRLNALVQRYNLKIGSTVSLTKCEVRFDEADLQAESIIIIHELTISGFKESEDCIESNDLPWFPVSNTRQSMNVPLISGRGCYVNVWTSADVVIPETITSDNGKEENGIENLSDLDLCCVSELATRWGRIQESKPPVLVRVVRKSRLINYSRTERSDKWPFQLHYLVSDKSGYCTLVLWNVLCLKYIKQIKEGTVLMLRNFTVKKSFNTNYQWHLTDKDLDVFPIDINVNAHHPVAEVTILNNRSLPRQLRLAELKHRFITRNQLSSLPDNLVCDVAGMVVHVGRVEREAVKNKSRGDSGGFWLSRWIHLQDHTHEKPFIIQIYSGQDPIFETLKPYQVAMCRHVRVQHNLQTLNSSRQRRHIYLTSTALSHCVTLQQPLSPTVRAWMINVSRRLTELETELEMTVGGYFSFPPLPISLEDFKQQHPNITITPCSAWKDGLENISYRQRVRLYVQAQLAALKFQGIEKLTQGRGKKKKKMETLEAVVNKNTHENIEHFDSISSHQVEDCHLAAIDFTRGDKLNWLNLPSMGEPKQTQNGATSKEIEELLVVTWQGLNSRVLLHTMKPMAGVSLPRSPDFADLTSGTFDSENEEDCEMSAQSVKELLQSACSYSSDRFLLVLDVCRDTESHVEVVLNRAFVL